MVRAASFRALALRLKGISFERELGRRRPRGAPAGVVGGAAVGGAAVGDRGPRLRCDGYA